MLTPGLLKVDLCSITARALPLPTRAPGLYFGVPLAGAALPTPSRQRDDEDGRRRVATILFIHACRSATLLCHPRLACSRAARSLSLSPSERERKEEEQKVRGDTRQCIRRFITSRGECEARGFFRSPSGASARAGA